MKLGLFGGGFKPFTTGHYARLLSAIHDNDRVYLFYGVGKRKPPKIGKRGKPLKSSMQKFRKIGDTGRFYTPELSREIFNVYEAALEREHPEVEVEQTIGTTPISRIFDVLNEFSSNPDMYEKVTVYGDEETRKLFEGESYRYKELIENDKISFVSDSSLARDALLQRYSQLAGQDIEQLPQDVERMQTIRGTEVRSLASQEKNATIAKRFLPQFLNDEEKNRVVGLLMGDMPHKEVENEGVLRSYIRGMIRG